MIIKGNRYRINMKFVQWIHMDGSSHLRFGFAKGEYSKIGFSSTEDRDAAAREIDAAICGGFVFLDIDTPNVEFIDMGEE
jgi:hypothetical protein